MYTIKQANQELEKIVNYLKENKEYWNVQRNLKLHEVACYDYSNDYPLCYEQDFPENAYNEYYNFYWFCGDNYNMFVEWLDEENIDKDILHYIGGTSSFTIGNYADNNINYGIENILSDCYYFNYTQFDENLQILPYGEFILEDDEVQDELNYIVSNLFDDVKAVFEPIIKVANYIDDFKENQLDYFKEYLRYEEDNLQAEKEKRDIEIEANNKKVSILINKVKSVITLDELDMINRLYIKEEE